ncbi:MAG: hypothetical protein V3T72_19120, partial [Thermoanaerobaculia bacterium]
FFLEDEHLHRGKEVIELRMGPLGVLTLLGSLTKLENGDHTDGNGLLSNAPQAFEDFRRPVLE